jgi:hypothetical protein
MKLTYKYAGKNPYYNAPSDWGLYLEQLNIIDQEQLELYINYVEIELNINFNEYVTSLIIDQGLNLFELIETINRIDLYNDFSEQSRKELTDPYYINGVSENDFI